MKVEVPKIDTIFYKNDVLTTIKCGQYEIIK